MNICVNLHFEFLKKKFYCLHLSMFDSSFGLYNSDIADSFDVEKSHKKWVLVCSISKSFYWIEDLGFIPRLHQKPINILIW